MAPKVPWLVVSDFDGTLTDQDIGNELCKKFIPQKYEELRRQYKSKELNLREYQLQMWTHFPATEKAFRSFVRERAQFRPGVLEFISMCLERDIALYIASCGLRPYIDEALNALLPKNLRQAILEIRCNEARFGDNGIAQFELATENSASPYSLDKGAWCRDLKKNRSVKILAIGNGSSDQSFIGHSDALAATESLAEHCKEHKQPYIPFHDFHDLLKLDLFSSP